MCGGVVAGMVSWGVGCGHFGVPAVYTSMTHWREWIAAPHNTTSLPASHLIPAQNVTLTQPPSLPQPSPSQQLSQKAQNISLTQLPSLPQPPPSKKSPQEAQNMTLTQC